MHIIQLENILLSDQTPQAIVKIADFGLARYCFLCIIQRMDTRVIVTCP